MELPVNEPLRGGQAADGEQSMKPRPQPASRDQSVPGRPVRATTTVHSPDRDVTATEWATLCEELLAYFSDTCRDVVIAEIMEARAAVVTFGLPTCDQLAVARQVVVHRLQLRDGHLLDRARLDPQRHRRSASL
jgi:hypothetical protein